MTLQEEQLFGAPPGELVAVDLTQHYHDGGGVSVILHGWTAMRKAPMTLTVSSSEKVNTPSIIGGLTPILSRASGMSVAGFRRWAWAAHNRLGRAGFEVRIERCGKEPKH